MIKFYSFIILVFCALSSTVVFSQQTLYGSAPTSQISKALVNAQVIHQIDLWDIADESAENKMDVFFEAVQYSAKNNSEIKKGFKITFISTSGDEDGAAKSSSEFEAYIDESEYPGVIVAINQIINDINKRDANDKKGSMTYITNSGIKIGYLIGSNKEIAFISMLYSNAEIKAEFSSPDNFFEEFKEYIEIASKDLYLPENLEKLKKVKKSTQEAKDVIIDDI